MITKNKRLTGIIIAVALLLLLPLIAMQFTQEVNWTISDFIFMGGLLLGTGLLCELTLRKVKKARFRLMICGALLLALVLIWAELAVCIFGTPFVGS